MHDDSSRVPIGAPGLWRPDWSRRNVGALIGQSACKLLVRTAVVSTRARASGSVQAATTYLVTTMLHHAKIVFRKTPAQEQYV